MSATWVDTQLTALRALGRLYWPYFRFYREQVDILRALIESVETVVVAGNQLGKDFIAGFVCPTFFLAPQLYFPPAYVAEVESRRRPGMADHNVHTRRVVTTSVREKHLDVLWAEIGRYLDQSEVPLLEGRGGPLLLNALDLRYAADRELKKPYSYLVGMVSGDTGEGLAGHHAAYTLFVGDEASGLSEQAYLMAQGWAKKLFLFGNPNPSRGAFYRAVKGGTIAADLSTLK